MIQQDLVLFPSHDNKVAEKAAKEAAEMKKAEAKKEDK